MSVHQQREIFNYISKFQGREIILYLKNRKKERKVKVKVMLGCCGPREGDRGEVTTFKIKN